MLITMAKQRCDTVLKEVDEMSDAIDEQLNSEESDVQHELDVLGQLEHSVQEAIDNATDADVVDMEREVRDGAGTSEKLAEVEQREASTTSRPGLDCDVSSVKLDDIISFIGRPVRLTTANVAAKESVTPVFRCGEDGGCREVHCVCVLNDGIVRATCGCAASAFNDEMRVIHGIHSKNTTVMADRGHRVTYMKYKPDKCFYSPVNFGTDMLSVRLNSKSTTKHQVRFHSPSGKCFIAHVTVVPNIPLRVKEIQDCELSANMPYAFDTSRDEERFVLVQSMKEKVAGSSDASKTTDEDKQEETKQAKNTHPGRQPSCTRSVSLYQRGRKDPVSTYSPPRLQSPFFPTDVCFWRSDGWQDEKLLVADYANDCVHVVDVQRGEFRFERFLAAGCGDLVKPTTLDTDIKGHVWIGCGNGWVLKCETTEF